MEPTETSSIVDHYQDTKESLLINSDILTVFTLTAVI